MTHLLFTYDFGLIKRGLIGDFLSRFHDSYSYWTLATLSLLVFALWIGLLIGYVSRAARCYPDAWVILSAYFVSGGFLYLAHTVGYFDHIGLLICLICFFLPISPFGQAFRIVLCVLMLFAHEGLLLTVFPVIFFDSVLRTTLNSERHGWNAFFSPFAMVTVAIVLTYFLGQITLDEGLREIVLDHISRRAADFPIGKNSVEVLFRDGATNAAIMKKTFSNGEWRVFVKAVSSSLPYVVVVFLLMGYVARRLLPDHRALWITLGVAFTCSLAPLATTIFAWDFYRFASFTQTSATLILLSLISATRGVVSVSSLSATLLALIAVAAFLNGATDLPLFDGYELRRPPFLGMFEDLVDRLVGNNGIADIPPF